MDQNKVRGWDKLSSRQKALIATAEVSDLVLKTIALRDLKRRPADQVKGSKWMWTGIILINSAGLTSASYLLFGRRTTG